MTLLAFTLLSIATATSTGKSDPAKQHEAGKAQEAGYVSAEVEIPQAAPKIDESMSYFFNGDGGIKSRRWRGAGETGVAKGGCWRGVIRL